jgi:hypothetical protein
LLAHESPSLAGNLTHLPIDIAAGGGRAGLSGRIPGGVRGTAGKLWPGDIS